MPFELDPEEADWDDSLAVDSFTFVEAAALTPEQLQAIAEAQAQAAQAQQDAAAGN